MAKEIRCIMQPVEKSVFALLSSILRLRNTSVLSLSCFAKYFLTATQYMLAMRIPIISATATEPPNADWAVVMAATEHMGPVLRHVYIVKDQVNVVCPTQLPFALHFWIRTKLVPMRLLPLCCNIRINPRWKESCILWNNSCRPWVWGEPEVLRREHLTQTRAR